MAGILLVTGAPPEYLRDAALSASRELGFEVSSHDEWSHGASKGSLALSILFGAFVAYCDFKLYVLCPGDGTSHLVIERNNPWWTGVIGINRVKGRAVELANAVQQVMGQAGVPIYDRRDI
jgi:hypothetical protein